MDKTIRELERKVAIGVPGAKQRLARVRERTRPVKIEPFDGPFEEGKHYRVVKDGCRLSERCTYGKREVIKLKVGDVIKCVGWVGNGAWNPDSLVFTHDGTDLFTTYTVWPTYLGGNLEPMED